MSIRRQLKNVVKNYSDAQVKVREATSNDPWGPSSTLMSEIADLTYNAMAFPDIMSMIWKRLNDSGKNWRHVYKALVLLDYIIKTGSDKVAIQCKEQIYSIQTLKDFQYIEEGKDHGMNVREKAKQLMNLLKDDERLKNERIKAMKAKERLAQNPMGIGSGGHISMQRRSPALSPTSESFATTYNGDSRQSPTSLPAELESARPSTYGEEELQLQLALAMSKEEYDEESKKKKADELKLQMALEESKKENQREQFRRQSSLGHYGQSDNSLLDINGPGAAAMPSSSSLGQISDPWNTPQQAPVHSNNTDPWALGGAAAATPPRQSNDPWGKPPVDPWGGSPVAIQESEGAWGGQPPTYATVTKPLTKDPWSSPRPASTSPAPRQKSHGSPWEPFPANGHGATPKAVTIEDEFDMLSTRSKSPQTINQAPDPWDMTGLSDTLTGATNMHTDLTQPEKKDAKNFLGNHADLVNLDHLVSKPAATSNPFAMTIQHPSPFDTGIQQRSVPINQIPNSSSSGFGQPMGSTILPAPLLPGGPSPTMGMSAGYMGPPSQMPMYGAGMYPASMGMYQGYPTTQPYGQQMGNNPFM